jgi:hypothetical protein
MFFTAPILVLRGFQISPAQRVLAGVEASLIGLAVASRVFQDPEPARAKAEGHHVAYGVGFLGPLSGFWGGSGPWPGSGAE